MENDIFPVVTVGHVGRDTVASTLPVTINLDIETWEFLTDHLRGFVQFGSPPDTPPPDLRWRIREFIETILVNEMAVREYFADASRAGA